VERFRAERRLVELAKSTTHGSGRPTDPLAVEARAARCRDVVCAAPSSLDVIFASCDDEAGLRVAKALVRMRDISC
jgi:hypothetical protein